MWRFTRVAHFSFKDPAYVSTLINEANFTGAVLDVFIKSPSFDYENHTAMLLAKIYGCKNRPKREPQSHTNLPIDKVLNDARFLRFMDGFLQAKISPEKYVESLYNLSFLHKESGNNSTFSSNLRQNFLQFLSENLSNLSFDDLSKCLSVLSLAFPKLEAVPQAHKVLEQLRILLDKQNPTVESLPRIVLSLGRM